MVHDKATYTWMPGSKVSQQNIGFKLDPSVMFCPGKWYPPCTCSKRKQDLSDQTTFYCLMVLFWHSQEEWGQQPLLPTYNKETVAILTRLSTPHTPPVLLSDPGFSPEITWHWYWILDSCHLFSHIPNTSLHCHRVLLLLHWFPLHTSNQSEFYHTHKHKLDVCHKYRLSA